MDRNAYAYISAIESIRELRQTGYKGRESRHTLKALNTNNHFGGDMCTERAFWINNPKFTLTHTASSSALSVCERQENHDNLNISVLQLFYTQNNEAILRLNHYSSRYSRTLPSFQLITARVFSTEGGKSRKVKQDTLFIKDKTAALTQHPMCVRRRGWGWCSPRRASSSAGGQPTVHQTDSWPAQHRRIHTRGERIWKEKARNI